MMTSYFARMVGDYSYPNKVSIALYPPKWFSGRRYQALAPHREMLKMDEQTYLVEYQKILDALDPQKVFEELGADSILLCWESPGQFCHRRLVAEWLERTLGIRVPELWEENYEKQETLF